MFIFPVFELVMAIAVKIAYVCHVTLSPSFLTNVMSLSAEFYPEDIVDDLGFIKCEGLLSKLRDF